MTTVGAIQAMTQLPDLSCLSHGEKDALILALWAQALMAPVAELEARFGVPGKTPATSQHGVGGGSTKYAFTRWILRSRSRYSALERIKCKPTKSLRSG